jgi:sulfide dehydrogenase cytochrome subunit
MRSAWLVAALVTLPVGAVSQDAARGRNLAAACATCHGTEGRSAGGNESLAGMRAAELVRKLREFRGGAKPATVMLQISKGYSDAEMDAIAAYFAAQRK